MNVFVLFYYLLAVAPLSTFNLPASSSSYSIFNTSSSENNNNTNAQVAAELNGKVVRRNSSNKIIEIPVNNNRNTITSINFDAEYDQKDTNISTAYNNTKIITATSNSLNDINKLIIGEKIEEDDTEYVRVARPTKSNISIVEEFNFYASSPPSKNLKINTINNNNLNRGSY